MKLKKIQISFLLLFLFLGTIVCYFFLSKQKASEEYNESIRFYEKSKRNSTAYYQIEIPSNNDTLYIKLESKKKMHIIRFPNADVNTSVFIYDTVLNFPISYAKLRRLLPLFSGRSDNIESIAIDISKVVPKEYTLLYWSKRIKGYYPLSIK